MSDHHPADPLHPPPDRPRRDARADRMPRRAAPQAHRPLPQRQATVTDSQMEWFRGSPISKILLLISIVLYLIVHHTPHIRDLWRFDSFVLSSQRQGYRLLSSKILFGTNTEVIVGTSLQMYMYRKFEREMGSYQFLKFVLTICTLTIAQEMVLMPWLSSSNAVYWSYGGPYCVIGALFLYFHWYTPRLHPRFVSIFQFHFSEKSLYYFWLLYLLIGSGRDTVRSTSVADTLSGWYGALIPLCMGMIASWIYHFTSQNRYVVQLDRRMHATLVLPILRRFGLEDNNNPVAMMRGVVQHPMAAAIAANAPRLRQRQNVAPPAAAAPAVNNNNHWMQEIPLPEPDMAAVEQLTAMGFPQPQVMEALRQSHNNVEHAANRLLSGE